MNWLRLLKAKVKFKEPLKKHTSFKVGGACDYFIEPRDVDDLKLLIKSLKKDKIPFRVLGLGSNTLVCDKGVRGAVIHLGSPCFKRISVQNNFVDAGAGSYLNKLIRLAAKQGLAGLEFLSGIPGTVGGALIMNAGRTREFPGFGGLVESVTIVDYRGSIRILKKKDLKFGYRKSNLSKYIILSVRIKLIKKNKTKIQGDISRYIRYRKNSQDLSHPSAGCIFKNPPASSAGRLIDLCGLKERRIGDAVVSGKHANFIVNDGDAKALDILRLMNLIRKEVKKKFNLNLEPEVEIWQ